MVIMKKGQGAFEYLLLIGGVLFLTVAVLMILSTSMTQTAQTTTGSNISGEIQTNISEYGTVATAGAATTYPTATPKPTVTVTVIAGVTVTVVAKPTITPTPTPTATQVAKPTSTPSSIITTPEPQKEDTTKYVNWLLGIILVIAAIIGVKWLYDEYQHEYNR